jgi:hypothetical protein
MFRPGRWLVLEEEEEEDAPARFRLSSQKGQVCMHGPWNASNPKTVPNGGTARGY